MTIQAQRFKCEECGGEQHYDASVQKLKCRFCSATRDVPVGEGAGAGIVTERDLSEGLMNAVKGFGTEGQSKTCKCEECGAAVVFAGVETSTKCTFCGSAKVLVQAQNADVMRPESLLPFGVDTKAANAAFSSWMSGLWFRPNDLKHIAKVHELAGVYVPFWTFDAHSEARWTAEAGHYYYTEESYTATENGQQVTRTRQVRHTRWEHAAGQRSDDFDDVLVCASRGLPEDLVDQLTTFNTQKLVPYSPGFLSGWRAEEYAVDLQSGFVQARGKMDTLVESRCAGDVPGDTQRNLHVDKNYSALTFKHTLLPVWIAAYRYHDEVYRFLVNGQTGEVVGKAPWSWIKITLFTLSMIALCCVLYALFFHK